MNIEDYYVWREALASCAIEGNQYAIEMLDLCKKDPEKFLLEMYKLKARGNDEGISAPRHKKRPTRKSR